MRRGEIFIWSLSLISTGSGIPGCQGTEVPLNWEQGKLFGIRWSATCWEKQAGRLQILSHWWRWVNSESLDWISLPSHGPASLWSHVNSLCSECLWWNSTGLLSVTWRTISFCLFKRSFHRLYLMASHFYIGRVHWTILFQFPFWWELFSLMKSGIRIWIF